MNLHEAKGIINDTKLPGSLRCLLHWYDDPGLDGDKWLQIYDSEGVCSKTGEPCDVKGRKWRLSRHMTRSEIVQTILMATLAFAEHEIREVFKYKGVAVFAPHFDIDELVEVIEEGDLPEAVRPKAPKTPSEMTGEQMRELFGQALGPTKDHYHGEVRRMAEDEQKEKPYHGLMKPPQEELVLRDGLSRLEDQLNQARQREAKRLQRLAEAEFLTLLLSAFDTQKAKRDAQKN